MPYLSEEIYHFIHLYIKECIPKLKLIISAANNCGLSKFKEFEINVIFMLYSYKLTVIFLNIIKMKQAHFIQVMLIFAWF